jgi:hypothetical protein
VIRSKRKYTNERSQTVSMNFGFAIAGFQLRSEQRTCFMFR